MKQKLRLNYLASIVIMLAVAAGTGSAVMVTTAFIHAEILSAIHPMGYLSSLVVGAAITLAGVIRRALKRYDDLTRQQAIDEALSELVGDMSSARRAADLN